MTPHDVATAVAAEFGGRLRWSQAPNIRWYVDNEDSADVLSTLHTDIGRATRRLNQAAETRVADTSEWRERVEREIRRLPGVRSQARPRHVMNSR